MPRSRRALSWLLIAGLAAGSGCAVYARPRAGVVYVAREPPLPRVEVIVAMPGAGYVWVPGYWAWESADFVWIGGRWMMPPRGHRRYEPGRWVHERRGWYYRDGRWR